MKGNTVAQPWTPKRLMDKLNADLTYWQRELRLDGIEIEIRWMDKDINEGKELSYALLGCMEEYNGSFLYVIKIENQGKLKSRESASFGEDYECILVHELIHILNFRWETSTKIFSHLISGKRTNEILGELYEMTINVLAEALVRARRGMKR